LFVASGTALAWSGCAVDVTLGKRIPLIEPGVGGGSDGGHGGMGGFDQGTCENLPGHDDDGDGFTPEQGDCNDCNPNQNPNAVEVPTTEPGSEPVDEDCDGLTDESDPTCDHDDQVVLRVDDPDPQHAAWAIDVCKTSAHAGDWGLVSATWVLQDGSAPPSEPDKSYRYHLGHGLLDDFGPFVEVRRGVRMLGLSSGIARRPNDPDYHIAPHIPGYDKEYGGDHPPGFPKSSPSCPTASAGEPRDAAALELQLRTPSNAKGVAFDFDFYTAEWPMFVCSAYNDLFIALLAPAPPGLPDGNVSFDAMGNLVSVNNAFLEVCGCDDNPPNPCMAGGKPFECSLGNAELIGTGFGYHDAALDHGATSWLETRAPVDPSSVVHLRFAIYDSTDALYDSLVLVDNVRWIAQEGGVITIPVPR
jgi:hypothetical protein